MLFTSYQLFSTMTPKLVLLLLSLSASHLAASPSHVSAPSNLATTPSSLATASPTLATAPPNQVTGSFDQSTAPPSLATAPPNLATVLPNLKTAPPSLATAPPNLATTPPSLATAPLSLATAPPNLATAPSSLATAPPNLATDPPNLATGSPDVETAPPNLATAPPNLETAPPTNAVRPLCPASADVCETSLYLEDAVAGIYTPNLRLIADGFPKSVRVYNDSLPGPPIVVYEGQQVAVKFVNGLPDEATTIHWHGVEQLNTPWMDGADGVSHCPILPGQSFTYRFLANPSGTHWYHAHHGTQRTMGAAGPLIILPRTDERQQELRGSDPLPVFDDEFILVVTDWMRNDSVDINMMARYLMGSYPFGYDNDICYTATKQADGLGCGVFPYASGLINGKGHYYLNGSTVVNTPLERFKVKVGGRYRFRVISTSLDFTFRLSIDNHDLHIIASDGGDVVTTKVESVMIASGERYDFWIDASDPIGNGSYWIRAETLERFKNDKPMSPNHIEAVLQYGDTSGDPTSSRRLCTPTLLCNVLNCPYKSSLPQDYIRCLHVTDLRATSQKPTLPAEPDNFIQHFLNFHFAGEMPSINGLGNTLPVIPYQLGGVLEEPCNQVLCDSDYCQCPHVLHIPLGTVVQLVLAITIFNPDGVLGGTSHPVHIHGQKVQVIKTGFPSYDPDTNFLTEISTDFECITENCNILRWTDPSWMSGNVSGAITEAPPTKDTVAIPVGGYVVVRFRANNPGYWYIHCHVEFHNSAGMAMVLKAGEDSDMVPPPNELPRCHNFYFTDTNQTDNCEPMSPDLADRRAESEAFYMNTTICLLVVLLVLIAGLILEEIVMRRNGTNPDDTVESSAKEKE